jgi:molecular chaperone IbpA
MVTTFGMDLFRDPFFIGFNREIERMANVHHAASRQSYPPYDVLKLDEDTFQVSLAVAGFSKDDIQVTVEDGTLKVTGEIVETTEAEVLHRGIAARKFTRSFALGEYMEVSSASLENGMLIIKIVREIPEEKKPKTIKIK